MVLAEVIHQAVATTLHPEVGSYLLAVTVIHLEHVVARQVRAHLEAEARALCWAAAFLLPGSAPVVEADLEWAASFLEQKQIMIYDGMG